VAEAGRRSSILNSRHRFDGLQLCANGLARDGERLIWLDRAVVDRLRSLRGPGESYSDVILRIAAAK
jgi:hypothetical protein